MPDAAPRSRPRRGRLGLYGPFAALGVLAILWSGSWFYIRGRVVSGLDEWIGAEAAAGRRWTCLDRRVGGYPFRIEIGCATLTLERPDVQATLGGLVVVAQVYNPAHIIAEASGPLAVRAGPTAVDATWTGLQASIVTTARAQRAALVADGATVRVSTPELGAFAVPGRRFELHVRPDPADSANVDVAVSAAGTAVPGLDGLIGGTEPADLELVARVSRVYDLPARPLGAELERWRVAGGEVQVSRLAVTKGARRFEAKGRAGIDESHRPVGQVDAAAAGIEGVLGRFIGDKGALGAGLLGALLGAPPASQPKDEATAKGLRPLPPIRFDGGRVLVGPLAVPGVRIPALY